ncbi:MAG: hypothetical protein JJT96_00205 [Opitutales bacterium]|nr:hypothetical protein [Opitutales bacterium]
MKLTTEQQTAVAAWVGEGASLADVQRRLEADYAIRATYMDVRFLIDDLGLEIRRDPVPVKEAPPAADLVEEPEPVGGVKVAIDAITRPGALVSGTVTFSDGQGAVWFLDQAGRLALNPKKSGYQPTQEDVADFQIELRAAIEKKGGFF